MKKNILIIAGLALAIGGFVWYKNRGANKAYDNAMSYQNKKNAIVSYISNISASDGNKIKNILSAMPNDDIDYVYDYVINYLKTNKTSSLPSDLKSNIDRVSKTYNIFS